MSYSTSDNALMMQVKIGELEKLGPLFERYHRRLFTFFYRLTSRSDDSADLVQDVFERILKYRNTYTGNGSFATWIFRIAKNLHNDYYRRMKREAGIGGDDGQRCIDPDLPGPACETDHTDDRMLLELALDRLHPDKKQALILSRYEGFRYHEIAEIMDCSETAVKVRVFRGLMELREIITHLEKQRSDPDGAKDQIPG